MTRAIAMDLERRGYIVYVTVTSADEEHIVKSENRVDIKALWLDLTTVCAVCVPFIRDTSTNIVNRHPPRRPKSILRCKRFAP